jgi:hypothetical protein
MRAVHPGLPEVLRYYVNLRTSIYLALSTESRDTDSKPEWEGPNESSDLLLYKFCKPVCIILIILFHLHCI